jgi:hypothetical protein
MKHKNVVVAITGGLAAFATVLPHTIHSAGRRDLPAMLGELAREVERRDAEEDPLFNLGKVDAQIRLIESLIHNLPFLVGANLFFMGLPGPGSAEAKAWLDCGFLLGTVLLFGGLYVANQEIVRRELLPLRWELERVFGGQ